MAHTTGEAEDPAVASLRASFLALKESVEKSLDALSTRVGLDREWIIERQGELRQLRSDVDECLRAVRPNEERAVTQFARGLAVKDVEDRIVKLGDALTAHEKGHATQRSAVWEFSKWVLAAIGGGGIVFAFDAVKHLLGW